MALRWVATVLLLIVGIALAVTGSMRWMAGNKVSLKGPGRHGLIIGGLVCIMLAIATVPVIVAVWASAFAK